MEISKSCTACEEERHSLNGCDPLGEWEVEKSIFSSLVRNWTVVFTEACSSLTEGSQLWQQWDGTHKTSTESTNHINNLVNAHNCY